MSPATKLKILYVITKSNYGGAQRYVHDLARAAHRAGHEVAVAFGGDGTLAQKLGAEGIRTVSLASLERDVSLGSDLRSFCSLYRLIRDESPDVLHLNSSKAGALGALAARLFNLAVPVLFGSHRHRVATVFTGHGWAFNEDRTAAARFALRLVYWVTILLAHTVIAVSEATRQQVLAMPWVRHKLVVVHNGVGDVPLRRPDDAWAQIVDGTPWRTLHPTRPPFTIGTFSELHNNKGLAYAIEAVALLRRETAQPVVFAILGEGEERARLAEQVRRLGLEDSVLLAGYRKDAREMALAFDVFLLSSITEAFPYAVLEAGYAGVPVVATRVGGVPDLVEDMETGLLVEPRDPIAVASAVRFLLEHPDQRGRLARGIQARVREGFSVRKMTARTFGVYLSTRSRLLGLPLPEPEAVEEHGADTPPVGLRPSA